MIVLILLSEQMLKFWSWKTCKGRGKGHGKSWNFKIVKEYEPCCGGRERESEKTAHVGMITKIVDCIRIVFGLPYNYKPNLSLKMI